MLTAIKNVLQKDGRIAEQFECIHFLSILDLGEKDQSKLVPLANFISQCSDQACQRQQWEDLTALLIKRKEPKALLVSLYDFPKLY